MRATNRFVAAAVFTGRAIAIGLALAAGAASALDGAWETRAPISSKRYGVAVADVDGSLYAVGGTLFDLDVYGGVVQTLELYDPAANSWTTRAPMPTARSAFGAAGLNGLLYAAGGDVASGSRSRALEAYDPATNSWSTKASMLTARTLHCVVAVGGRLYAIGGNGSAGEELASVECYDPATGLWTNRAPISVPRFAFAAGAIDGRIYVAGGLIAGSPNKTSVVEAYDPTTNTWSTRAPLPHPTGYCAGAVAGGKFYVIGGGTDDGHSEYVDVYDPATDSWTSAPPLPTPRANPGAAGSLGVVYAIGGWGPFNPAPGYATVEAFTPSETPWTIKAPMPTARAAFGELAVLGGRLHALGGSNDTILAVHESYDPTTGSWTTRAPLPTPLVSHATAVANGILYVVGGNLGGTSANSTAQVSAYDPASDSWTARAPLPQRRQQFAAAVVDGVPYAIGGSTNNVDWLASVAAYDPATNTWTPRASLPTARRDHVAAVVDGRIYVFAGSFASMPPGGQPLPVDVYDPVADTWTRKSNMPSIRSWPMAAGSGGLIYVAGGSGESDALTTVDVYDPPSDTWSAAPTMGVRHSRGGAAAIGGVVYVAGGNSQPESRYTGALEAYTPSPADADPPVVEIMSPAPDSVVGTASVAVTAHVTDASPATVTSSPAGLAGATPAGGGTITGTVPLPVEGVNAVSVHATDSAGRTGGTSVEVIRDTTAPVVTVTSPAAGAVVGTSPVNVTVDVQDLTATTLEVAGAQQGIPAGGGSRTFSVALAAGPNDISVTATDAAGHQTTLTHSVVLDLDAPVVTIDAPADGQLFGAGASPVAVTARVDDLSATTVSSVPAGVADVLPAGGGSVLGAVDLVEGTNTITVSATDAADLVGSAAVTVVVDTTPPVASLASPHDGDAIRGVVDLHVAADDPLPGSGVASVAVTLDGNPLVTLTSAPFETTLDTASLADGPHVLAATATDGLGNASAPVSISIRVDNIPPVVVITAPTDGSLVGGQVPYEVTVSDATSGVVEATMTVGGQAPTTDASATYATPVASDQLLASEDTTRWPDGPLPFAATARDAAGNVATATVSVQTDNSNPSASLVAPHEGDIVHGTIAIDAAASDPNLASLTILVDGVEVATSPTSPLSVPFDTTTRLDGPMTVELRVTDSIGNTSTSAVHVTVDNTSLTLKPSLLHLKATGGGGAPVDAELTGPGLALLLPTESHVIELRVPGGNSVPAVQGWDGDDALSGPGLTRLKVRFSRAALVASIRAGIAGGHIDAASRQVEVTLVADGRVQGTTVLGFTEGK